MRPLLRPGDRVRLEDRPPRSGDVALVSLQGRLVLQRLGARRGARWKVGAAAGASAGWVHADQVKAVAISRRREGDPNEPWVRIDRLVDRVFGRALAPAYRAARILSALQRLADPDAAPDRTGWGNPPKSR
jgi:hypothetical protein